MQKKQLAKNEDFVEACAQLVERRVHRAMRQAYRQTVDAIDRAFANVMGPANK